MKINLHVRLRMEISVLKLVIKHNTKKCIWQSRSCSLVLHKGKFHCKSDLCNVEIVNRFTRLVEYKLLKQEANH